MPDGAPVGAQNTACQILLSAFYRLIHLQFNNAQAAFGVGIVPGYPIIQLLPDTSTPVFVSLSAAVEASWTRTYFPDRGCHFLV